METLTEATAMKSNSTVASIRLGYRLYAGNFKNLFKSSWLFALLFGLVCGAIGTITSVRLPAIIAQAMANPALAMSLGQEYIGLLGVCLTLIVVGGAFEIVFYSCGFSLLRGHIANGVIARPTKWLSIDGWTAWRTAKGILSTILVYLLVGAVVGALYYIGVKVHVIKPDAYVGLAIWTVIAVTALFMTAIPMFFITTKYILDKNMRFWTLLVSDYKRSMRHFGYIFIVTLFVVVVIAVLTFVLQLPTVILSTANYQANLGVFYGDPLGMPSYIVTLTAIVFFISGFMQAYIRMSAIFPFYYMYGSIETQEEEKKQYNEQLVVGKAQ